MLPFTVLRTQRRCLIMLCLWALAPLTASAVPVLDPSFGAGGIVVAPADGWVDSIAVRADGKLVLSDSYVVGSFFLMGVHPIFAHTIARLDARGAVDQSFAGGGISASSQVSRLLLQPDGKMLAVSPANTYVGYLLVRYLPEGSLDSAFTAAAANAMSNIFGPGKRFDQFSFGGIALQADGKIVLAGSLANSANPGGAAALMRFNADGTIDSTFGDGGYTAFVNPNVQFEQAGPVVVQPTGKIIVGVATISKDLLSHTASLLQLSGDGTPDSSFGDGGRSTYPGVSPNFLTFDSLVRQPNGSVVAGVSLEDPTLTSTLRRYEPDGVLDVSFGNGGVVTRAGPGPLGPGPLLVQPDGKLLAGLTRYTANGAPDSSFGDNGSITTPPIYVHDITLAPDGALLVGGALPCSSCTGSGGNPAVLRYLIGSTAAVEFYNAAFDHYFISSNPLEIALLDAGVIKGWARTGQLFYVFGSGAAAPAGYVPVCRFYIPPDKGNSHFFSASAAQCAELGQRSQTDPNYAGYIEESAAAFFVALPDTATGTCPSDTVAVYRLWNHRADVDHRYTTDLVTRDQMISRGYISEGYGPFGVAMCVPAPAS